jgi:hypothetical protein
MQILDATLAAARAALAGVTVDQRAVPLIEPTAEPEAFPFLTLTEGGAVAEAKGDAVTVAFTVRAVTRDATMRASRAVLDEAVSTLKGVSVDGFNFDRFNAGTPESRVSGDGRSKSLSARVSVRVRPKRKR